MKGSGKRFQSVILSEVIVSDTYYRIHYHTVCHLKKLENIATMSSSHRDSNGYLKSKPN